jgi:ABC-type nickel/cobalt efflux system permease component RcnA
VRSLQSPRAALAIVASIAIRPCSGALFVLVIAARFEAFAAGVLAVLAMALGTAATTLTVAAGGRLARLFAVFGQEAGSAHALRLSAALHILGGGLILGLSLLVLAPRMI